MTRRCSPLLVALVLVGLVVAGCGGDDDGDNTVAANCTPEYRTTTLEKGVLKVASTAFPPYSDPDPSADTIGGVDGAIITRFAKQACLELDVSEVPFAAAVSAVSSRRVDVALGSVYGTPERAKVVALAEPLYRDENAIISKQGYSTMDELAGKSIETVQGYYFADPAQKVYGDDLKLVPGNVNMYQDLAVGRAEVGLDSYAAANYYLEERNIEGFKVVVPEPHPTIPIVGPDVGQVTILYSKKAPVLGESLNRYIRGLKESGQMADMLAANGFPRSAAKTGPPRW
jgi:polar amino acid transport system substrate-binding protein